MGESELILSLRDVAVAYGGIIAALHGVTLEVKLGAVVALLGPNGAGKSTTLKAASGLLHAERGAITAGSVTYFGTDQSGKQASSALARQGLVQVLEGRHCFTHLTVEENLRCGALLRREPRSATQRELARVYERFPRLQAKHRLAAGFLSGGEQQMLAIGRALMARPRLVLLDEPSMGLAPQIVAEIFEIVRALNRDEGTSFLLAEQNAVMGLRYADYGYVLEAGRVVSEGSASELTQRDEIRQFYLGTGAAGRTSFRPFARARAPA